MLGFIDVVFQPVGNFKADVIELRFENVFVGQAKIKRVQVDACVEQGMF